MILGNFDKALCKRMRIISCFVILTCFVIITQLFLVSNLDLRNVFNSGRSIKKYKDLTQYVGRESNKAAFDSYGDVTVVSAFFDIGSFSKRTSHRRDTEIYYRWMKIFRYIKNNVVFFADSDEIGNRMLKIRNQSLEKTKIVKVNRSNAWPFLNFQRIQSIFRSKSYSLFTSIYPIYTCVTHAKYYVMKIAAEENYFRTKYIMWLDIGYFRRRFSKNPFYLSAPEGFDISKIAVTQVFPNKTFDFIPHKILKSKNVIISGALFFGERYQIIKYVMQFKRAVEYFLKNNLTNTDEQIVFAMYSTPSFKPDVKLQLYQAEREKDWFYVGYTMIRES